MNEYSSIGHTYTHRRGVIFDGAAEQRRATFEMNKSRYNLPTAVRKLKIGDGAFINNTKLSSVGNKYTQKLVRPKRLKIRIKERFGSDTYFLTNLNPREIVAKNASEL